MKVSVIDKSFFARYDGLVGENHVLFLVPTLNVPRLSVLRLGQLLRTDIMDRAFRCVAGSSSVSVHELESLPFPDPAALESKLRMGWGINRPCEMRWECKTQHHSWRSCVSPRSQTDWPEPSCQCVAPKASGRLVNMSVLSSLIRLPPILFQCHHK